MASPPQRKSDPSLASVRDRFGCRGRSGDSHHLQHTSLVAASARLRAAVRSRGQEVVSGASSNGLVSETVSKRLGRARARHITTHGSISPFYLLRRHRILSVRRLPKRGDTLLRLALGQRVLCRGHTTDMAPGTSADLMKCCQTTPCMAFFGNKASADVPRPETCPGRP